VEFAGEGHRFNDLVRWGTAKSVMNGRAAVNIYNVFSGDNGFLYKCVFTDRDYLWPVPAVEIERNPLIEQNPGW
ncbi:MAG: RagB/SusD family nutrient uptake outer membrane protein, partial [Tannerella sp.]|nr:RagB/SusD family nutrient uptake outer membrane protein [Tannerella sp.]